MSKGIVKELRDRAQHCRDLSRVTRDKIVEAELHRLADEFEAEAAKEAKRKAD